MTAHPALYELAPEEHLRAEQAMTRRYGRVMPAFMTTTLASFLPVAALERDRRSARARLHFAGLGCYAAMLSVTLTRNLPINARLLELEPADQEEFGALRARWDRLHTARNALNVAGLACTTLSALAARS